MRKALMVVLLALSFMAVSHAPVQASDPIPQCNPCPFVR